MEGELRINANIFHDGIMADEKETHFHFDFGGITLEVSGGRDFVQEMYQKVMKDVADARRSAQAANRKASKKVSSKGPTKKPSVWVHRCSEMMRKIYMASQDDISASPICDIVDVDVVSGIYVDKGLFELFFPKLDDGQTLWAEFTAVGRKKIADVTQPNRRALQLPKSTS